jgi:hypothetical protein
MRKKSSSALALAVSLFVLVSLPTTSNAGAIINIYEDGGGLNLQFSGDLNAGTLSAPDSACTCGYLDFDGFNGTTGSGWVGFFGSPSVEASYQFADGLVTGNVSSSFGTPSSTGGSWSLVSGTKWFDDIDGGTNFFSSAGTLSSGSINVDAHLFLSGGSLAVANLVDGSSFVRTIDYTDNGGGLDSIGVIVSAPAVVPEPSIIALFGLGLVGIGFARRKRQS